MNCIDYRRLITSDPSHAGAEGLRHRMACRGCAQFVRDMQQFDASLREAMLVPAADDLGAKIMLAATGKSRANHRWIAVAATFVVALGATLVALTSYSTARLPQHVVQHLYHEAELLVPVSTELVPRDRLVQVLERTGVRLIDDVENVIHAGICLFRGHLVSHLVVNSEDGPITVLLLPDEQVSESMPINEDGFRGVIVPVKGGSIAVIGSKGIFPHRVERKFVEIVEWST